MNRARTKIEKERMWEALERIGKEQLALETMETRYSDDLDFHDIAVWNIKNALQAAYEAGRKASR